MSDPFDDLRLAEIAENLTRRGLVDPLPASPMPPAPALPAALPPAPPTPPTPPKPPPPPIQAAPPVVAAATPAPPIPPLEPVRQPPPPVPASVIAWRRPVLPRLSRADALLSRRLHRARQPLAVTLAGRRFTLMVTAATPDRLRETQAVRLAVRVGTGVGSLGLSRALPDLLLVGLEVARPGHHPDFDLLLEAALEPLLVALETATSRTITLASPLSGDEPPRGMPVALLEVTRDGIPAGLVSVRLPEPEFRLFLDVLDQAPPQGADMEWLRLPVCIKAGFAMLSLAALRTLRAGDILLSDARIGPDQARIAIAGTRPLAARRVARGFEIIPHTDEAEGTIDMAERGDGSGGIDDLVVPLVFEIGSKEVPLSELRRMQPGYVIELDRSAALKIDLTIRGRLVGKAELVQVDDTVGARILRLFGDE